jgi:hypothetical protein
MKPTTLYRICYHAEDTPSGFVQEWFSTWTKAMRRLRQLGLADECEVRVTDVPRTRLALAEFLNAHANVR